MIQRRWTLFFSLLALVLAFLGGYGLLGMVEAEGLAAVQARVARLHPFATAVRLVLIALVAAFWGRIARFLAARYRLGAAGEAALVAWRWRAVTWLLVIELVLGQDLLNHFFAHRLSAKEIALEIHIHDFIPIPLSHVKQGCSDEDTRIIYENVNDAKLLYHLLHHGLHITLPAGVSLDSQRTSAEPLNLLRNTV